MLDLETTGVDISLDRVVELAAVHCPADSRFFGGGFSTVVRVEPELLLERGAAAQAVHGISNEEISAGPDFHVAWSRFLSWLEELLNSAVVDTADSDEEDWETRLLPDPPVLLLAGHNAFRFDFPLLLCECMRRCISCDCFRQWVFVDTMHVAQAVAEHGCIKLQCLVQTLGNPSELRAHRALDDCVALRLVCVTLAEKMGTDLWALLRGFSVEVDLTNSLAQLSVLMES